MTGGKMHYTASHWGLYEVGPQSEGGARLRPFANDPDPSPIGLDQLGEAVSRLRVARPAVRESWLREGPGAAPEKRGREPFVEVGWEQALDLVASELKRITQTYGNEAIFGGSYGWSSAGRFHHAQSQVHRFLNAIGGYVRHVDTYSLSAGRAIMPHIVGQIDDLHAQHTSWDVIAEHTRLFVSFGGVPLKNSRVSPGGAGRHRVRDALCAMSNNGGRLISISPIRHEPDTAVDFEWIPIRPNTDVALMLALAHQLFAHGLADIGFLTRYCVGADTFRDYVMGRNDGVPKTHEWAEAITGVPRERIVRLAREMAATTTMLNVAWSLQRAQHGEQPFWTIVALASVLGQIGLPGGGFGLGYGSMNAIGSRHPCVKGPSLPQGANPVDAFIPVSRIADLLLHPGGPFNYQGRNCIYPDIRLVYWAGGNPFHHHQDLNRLRRAWEKPDTVIVHEQFWNPLARMADILLPATLAAERDDIGFATREGLLVAMRKVVEPRAEARDDYAIFTDIAARMNVEDTFTEGLSPIQWLKRLYSAFAQNSRAQGIDIPSFETFWENGLIDLSPYDNPVILLQSFRDNPDANPLPTSSGRIELFCAFVEAAGAADCPPHPTWIEPDEWLGSLATRHYPLHFVSDQPERRLHSQLDHAAWSLDGKAQGRERLTINRKDAMARGIVDGDVVEIFNDRGRCQASAQLSDDIKAGVVRLATGAWFDPAQAFDAHSNPNMLTTDRPASTFSQGCAALTCLVDIARSRDPKIPSAHDMPAIIESDRFETDDHS
ncbi:MAG: molybdopterin-dependent oxidoreductase [Hyphomicrobiales bacterium]|nr:molybdopterin-dependent oxidoreductase [Hyphomicrobiales bacterium]